ncbi:MAG TPA: ABC transporter permease [Epulopiscium sp.]|nr:ABC transporter permease [Candidatus Epulonipiscium sp.]
MKIRTLKYLTKEGILGIWKNRLMSLASIGTIMLCLIILGISYSIASNVDYILKQIESNIGITAYIGSDLKEEEITALKRKIETIPSVTVVTYISQDDALLSFSQDSSIENIMEQFKQDNPLPASFEIKMDDLENQDTIIQSLEQYGELELSYFKAETPMLVQLNKSIRLISIIVILSLTMVGILLMSNTIKLTVYIRRKEINIMKYIGAADWFIRAPFVIEGIAIGLIGGMIPIVVIWSTYTWTIKAIRNSFGLIMDSIQLQQTSVILSGFIPMCLILGVSIGTIGSVIAIRKHLQV